MTPIQYCYEKVKTSKSNFTWAFYFISQDRRDALISLYAFCREIDDIVDYWFESLKIGSSFNVYSCMDKTRLSIVNIIASSENCSIETINFNDIL